MSNFLSRLVMRNTAQQRSAPAADALVVPRLGSRFERKTDFTAGDDHGSNSLNDPRNDPGNDQAAETDETVRSSFATDSNPDTSPDTGPESLPSQNRPVQPTTINSGVSSSMNSGSEPQTRIANVHAAVLDNNIHHNNEIKPKQTISAAPEDKTEKNIDDGMLHVDTQAATDRHGINSDNTEQIFPQTLDTNPSPVTTERQANDQIRSKQQQNITQEQSLLSSPPQLRQTSGIAGSSPVAESIIERTGGKDKNIHIPDSAEMDMSSSLAHGETTRDGVRKPKPAEHENILSASTSEAVKDKKIQDIPPGNHGAESILVTGRRNHEVIQQPVTTSILLDQQESLAADGLQKMDAPPQVRDTTSAAVSSLNKAEQPANPPALNKIELITAMPPQQGDKPGKYHADGAEHARPASSLTKGQEPAAAPTIKISIGRIDIQATNPPPAPTVRGRQPRRGPAVSLHDYLNKG